MSDCGCNLQVKTVNLGTRQIWSSGAASPGLNYFIFTPEEGIDTLTPLISQLRASLMIQQATGTFESQVFFQLSEDSITWDPVTPLDGVTFLVGNGASTCAWYSATSNYKRYIRFGVTAGVTGGTPVQMANASLIIDILLK